jgi:carbonic anhydrase
MAYSRRELFRGTLAGAATAAFVGAYERPVSAQTSLTPEAALQQLIDGNRRFAEGGMTSFNEDLNVLRAKTSPLCCPARIRECRSS